MNHTKNSSVPHRVGGIPQRSLRELRDPELWLLVIVGSLLVLFGG